VFVSRRAAVLAALMMASCLLLSIEGRIAKTDAMLLATTVAAMGALARVYLPEQRELLKGVPRGCRRLFSGLRSAWHTVEGAGDCAVRGPGCGHIELLSIDPLGGSWR